MKNSIYLPGIVPMKDVEKYKTSQAATNFNRNIISTGYFSQVISIPPIIVDGRFKSHYDTELGIQYHIIRRHGSSTIGRLLDAIEENIWLIHKILKSTERNVWYYNIDPVGALSFEFLRLFTNKRVFVLLADFNPSRNKGIKGKIIMHCLKKANGILSLSARCKGINKNQRIIPGIIKANKVTRKCDEFHNNRTFLLSGYLNNNNGLQMALEVFKEVHNATLYLSGVIAPGLNAMVDSYTSKYPNIIYKGYYSNYEDYLELLHSCDFVLSLSDLAQPVNQYNFPSKILEALSYGKIVVSANTFEELEGINYIKCDYTKQSIMECVESLISGNRMTEIRKCQSNAEAILNKYTEHVWIQTFETLESQ